MPKSSFLFFLCALAVISAKAQTTYHDLTVSLQGYVYSVEEGVKGTPLPGVSIRCV